MIKEILLWWSFRNSERKSFKLKEAIEGTQEAKF